MAISYTLSIGSVKKRLTEGEFSDVIVEASFSVQAYSGAETTGSEEEGNLVVTQPAFSYSCGGSKDFSIEGLTAETFISFADITKDTIKGWLLASEGVTDVEEFSYVKSSIENIAKRIHDYGLEVPANVAGTNPSGSSTYTYTPPEPTPEPAPEPTPEETPAE